MFDAKTLAVNIRKARLFRNYTQEYLAYKLGLSQNAYSKIELCQTMVSVEKLLKIAEILEVDFLKLLNRQGISADIETVSKIPIVPQLLDVICRTTGMGFAAIARVTDEQWVACSVLDKISFGLKPGDELKLETTICNEIRQSKESVIIDHVSADSHFCNHPVPAMYGFQSYISVPIFRQDGSFFGTLCSIDPKPAKLNNPETIGMFNLFAQLISFYVDSIERVAFARDTPFDETKKADLQKQLTEALGTQLPDAVQKVLSGHKD